MSQEILNAYRSMWVFCFFDLPVITSKQRKQATNFREYLKEIGFDMYQYSVYQRFCKNREFAGTYIRKVERALPPNGHVSIMQVTDKQYGMIKNLVSRRVKPMMPEPPQLDFF